MTVGGTPGWLAGSFFAGQQIEVAAGALAQATREARDTAEEQDDQPTPPQFVGV